MAQKKKNKNEPVKAKEGKAGIERAQTIQRNLWFGTAAIAVITFLIYLPVFSNGFVNLDDDLYIEKQQLIRGFDFKALFCIDFKALFVQGGTEPAFVQGNYHPLVMMVYTIIYHFFQLNPKAYHFVNLMLYIINSGLVLWLFFYITESFEVALIVGLLFGVHPLHVESVAWASELKDLMYTFGFLSSLIFYVRYLKEKQPVRLYILSLLFFLFSLLSKGMGASLALVIFLVDFYAGRKFTVKTIMEKIPFFILAIIFGYIAIKAQKSQGAIQDLALFTFPQRIVFACYGFITYIIRVFAPFNLCAYYPYPVMNGDSIPSGYYAYPVIFFALIAGVFYSLKKTKKIFFGIGFSALTVILVLQLLPVGGAITADRYTYIPSIGIFFLIAEGLIYLNKKNSSSGFNPVTLGILGVVVIFFSCLTFNQVKIWKDGMTMWSNVINNYQTVSLAYNQRGLLYRNDGQLDKAMDDYTKALQLNPVNEDAWSNIGGIYWQEGLNDKLKQAALYDSAMKCLNRAIQIKPDFATAYGNRGSLLFTMGNLNGAVNDFTKSIQLDPNFADSYYNRGIANLNLGKKDLACPDLKRAAELGYGRSADAYRDLCK